MKGDGAGLAWAGLLLLVGGAFGWGRRRGRREGLEEGERRAPLVLRGEGLRRGACVLCGGSPQGSVADRDPGGAATGNLDGDGTAAGADASVPRAVQTTLFDLDNGQEGPYNLSNIWREPS